MGSRNKIYKNELTRNDMIERYLSGTPTKDIAEEFGVTERGIRYIMKEEGIETRKTGQPRKNKVNEDFFKTWSNEMAWVLGMFLTDGCVSKNSHTVTISQKDTSILEKIAKAMDADFVLAKQTKTKRTPTLLINSMIIKEDLINLGISPKKSLTVEMPPIPKEYMPSFIRGVIDGDGWVQDRGYIVTITSASEKFSNTLKDIFISWELNTRINGQKTERGNPIYRIIVSGKQDVINLYDIIYDDSDLFVERKKLRMGQHKSKGDIDMWENINGVLIHTTDENRKEFKTTIKPDILQRYREIAEENNTTISYLFESLFENIMKDDNVYLEKTKGGRVDFRTTCDKELLNDFNIFAKSYGVGLNTIIEQGIKYIDLTNVKDRKWAYRIEKK